MLLRMHVLSEERAFKKDGKPIKYIPYIKQVYIFQMP